MPTKLQQVTASQTLGTYSMARRWSAALAIQASARQSLAVRGPWPGFVPDMDPNLLPGSAFSELRNVLARPHGSDHGEVLGLPDGYRQVDSARLPLGDGSTLPANPVTDGTAIVRIHELFRFAPTTHATNAGESGVEQYVLTGLVATAGTGVAATGNLYRVNASGQWTRIGPAPSMSAARQLSADRDGRTTSPSMPDSASVPFGAVNRDANTAGVDDLQSGPIDEPCWIYTNDVDEVMVFPSSSAQTLLGNHFYEPLCDPTSSAALDGGGADGFKARSVEVWNGRVYFLNTSENGIRRNQRLRRTARFTADPDPAIVGSGFYDFRDFQGEGQRVETLGDVLAVYFSDGVAFVRPTGVATAPDEPQVVSTDRGLLGTHALTSIGRNVHFGIFTDGWWLLDQSGRWQEVGITQEQGRTVHKWRQTFYERLDPDQRHRLYCYYDQPQNRVYIVLPTDDNPEPQEVWIYDPVGDRVFMENYSVTCMGSFTPPESGGTLINSLPGTIDSLPGTIDSYGVVAGFPRGRIHGDLDGYVYRHSHGEFEGFDSATSPPIVQDPTWSFQLGMRALGGMRNLSTVDRVTLEYFDHQNTNATTVEVFGAGGATTQSQASLLTQGSGESLAYQDYWFRLTSFGLGARVSGTGEFHIRALEMDVFTDPSEPREQVP